MVVPPVVIDVDERHLAGGDGAGLVEHDGVDLAGRFEHLRSLDQDAELRAAAGADHQRGRRGQSERAWAGDDQHRDGGGERGRRVVGRGGGEPEPEGRERQGDDDRDEDRRDAVGQALHVGLAGLRLLDHPADLGERGVGPDACGAHDEPAAGVDGRACHRDRRAPPRRGPARRSATTRRSPTCLLRRSPSVAIFSPGRTTNRSPTTSSSTGMRNLDAVAEHGDVLRAELEQCLQRGARSSLRACLEVTAGEDEHRHAGGDLEVDLAGAHAPLGRDRESVAHRRARRRHRGTGRTATTRTRRASPTEISVSIVAAAWRRFVHAAVWNGHAPHVTTGAARVSDSHCQPSNCNAEIIAIAITGTARTPESDQALPERTRRALAGRRSRRSLGGGALRGLRQTCGVAGRFDLGDQVGGRDGVGEGDLGLLGGVVDRRGDAVHAG